MKTLTKTLILGLITLMAVDCSRSRFEGTPGTPIEGHNLAVDANEIVFTDDQGDPIAWSNDRRNIYFYTNEDCYTAIARNADDPVVQQARREMIDLINSSTVSTGTQAQSHPDSVYLTITYRDGRTRTFNLVPELASQDEESLSRGAEIIALFTEFRTALETTGERACKTGK